MSISRRNFIVTGLTGLAAGLTGCAEQPKGEAFLPTTPWPDVATPRAPMPSVVVPPIAGGTAPAVPAQPTPLIVGSAGSPSNPIPRARWTSASPLMGEINPMNGIHRITLHHEGWTSVDFADAAQTARRLDGIRGAHRGRGWADIGYHYVVDRAGRVWEGRNTKFQGAHVKENNEHNLGIMCLGNFDIQQPTDAQLSSMRDAVRYFRQKYNVATKMVMTHQEINPTSCPGRALQPRIVAMRHNGYFA
jgi:hypothetical protein